jgi:hypothetical protein
MKVVRTRLSEHEYELLRGRAQSEHRPLQDVVRDAIRKHVIADEVDPTDPMFVELAPRRVTPGHDRSSERIDELLYGAFR